MSYKITQITKWNLTGEIWHIIHIDGPEYDEEGIVKNAWEVSNPNLFEGLQTAFASIGEWNNKYLEKISG